MGNGGGAFDVEAYQERFQAEARRRGFTEHTYGLVGRYPLRAYTREAEGEAPARVYLSSGVHGDEPAGPLALLKLIREAALHRDVTWHLVPMINPTGMAAGTRENASGIDINRDYRLLRCQETARHIGWVREHAPELGYDLSLLLHEDWETDGFYLYELRPGPDAPSLAPVLLNAAEPLVGIAQAEEIDGFQAREGVIRPLEDLEDFDPEAREDLPEALLFYLEFSGVNYTLETPSGKYLPNRVDAQAKVIQAAIQAFLQHREASR